MVENRPEYLEENSQPKKRGPRKMRCGDRTDDNTKLELTKASRKGRKYQGTMDAHADTTNKDPGISRKHGEIDYRLTQAQQATNASERTCTSSGS